MTSQVAAVAAEIDRASSQPLPELERALARGVELLQGLPLAATGCLPQDRERFRSELAALQSRLVRVSLGLARGAEIFQGYCRLAGASCDEYAPSGPPVVQREPAFLSVKV